MATPAPSPRPILSAGKRRPAADSGPSDGAGPRAPGLGRPGDRPRSGVPRNVYVAGAAREQYGAGERDERRPPGNGNPGRWSDAGERRPSRGADDRRTPPGAGPRWAEPGREGRRMAQGGGGSPYRQEGERRETPWGARRDEGRPSGAGRERPRQADDRASGRAGGREFGPRAGDHRGSGAPRPRDDAWREGARDGFRGSARGGPREAGGRRDDGWRNAPRDDARGPSRGQPYGAPARPSSRPPHGTPYGTPHGQARGPSQGGSDDRFFSAGRDDRPARGAPGRWRDDGPRRDERGARGAMAPGGLRAVRQPLAGRDGAPADRHESTRDRGDAPTEVAGAQPVPQAPARGAPAIGERLNKRLADMRLCSRREADAWIENGWVLVNGQPAVVGQRVRPTDEVQVDERAKVKQAERVTILINKPMGYVSGQAEDGHEPAASLINAQSRWRGDANSRRFASWQLRGLAPAGRLDIDSVGLLVLTQDGRVARDIIGEASEVDKEYLVRVHYPQGDRVVERDVQAVFPPEQLARLRHGLELDGKPLLPAEVEWQNPEQLRFVLREGKKRQIRRMCELVGLHVVGLKRIRIGGVLLGNLPTGQWRYLGPHERF
ncbi:hypothetical protein CCO03_01620 [Comamonas serinivorans]|uniref:Dual-specificity RNA pseudouridine synthase RluF n=1 Tax=Comamonas serinivorans TaxID=1082851 RepID=A0A1Y0EIU0_9BURK|nr:pseudouridine synthase [Comamonas serinivorans]ARU03555.1 hypothetical protein CCO03_01620 [Comamonas serinivorans]